MKKIAFRISNEFSAHYILEFIRQQLKLSHVESIFFGMSESIQSQDFQGLVLLTNAQDTSHWDSEILRFHQESKPLIVFFESAKNVAKLLRQHNPVIAVQKNDPDIPQLTKLGIDTEICPADDFITDRFTKILSMSIRLTDSQMNSATEKGLQSLCKELVEMC